MPDSIDMSKFFGSISVGPDLPSPQSTTERQVLNTPPLPTVAYTEMGRQANVSGLEAANQSSELDKEAEAKAYVAFIQNWSEMNNESAIKALELLTKRTKTTALSGDEISKLKELVASIITYLEQPFHMISGQSITHKQTKYIERANTLVQNLQNISTNTAAIQYVLMAINNHAKMIYFNADYMKNQQSSFEKSLGFTLGTDLDSISDKDRMTLTVQPLPKPFVKCDLITGDTSLLNKSVFNAINSVFVPPLTETDIQTVVTETPIYSVEDTNSVGYFLMGKVFVSKKYLESKFPSTEEANNKISELLAHELSHKLFLLCGKDGIVLSNRKNDLKQFARTKSNEQAGEVVALAASALLRPQLIISSLLGFLLRSDYHPEYQAAIEIMNKVFVQTCKQIDMQPDELKEKLTTNNPDSQYQIIQSSMNEKQLGAFDGFIKNVQEALVAKAKDLVQHRLTAPPTISTQILAKYTYDQMNTAAELSNDSGYAKLCHIASEQDTTFNELFKEAGLEDPKAKYEALMSTIGQSIEQLEKRSIAGLSEGLKNLLSQKEVTNRVRALELTNAIWGQSKVYFIPIGVFRGSSYAIVFMGNDELVLLHQNGIDAQNISSYKKLTTYLYNKQTRTWIRKLT